MPTGKLLSFVSEAPIPDNTSRGILIPSSQQVGKDQKRNGARSSWRQQTSTKAADPAIFLQLPLYSLTAAPDQRGP